MVADRGFCSFADLAAADMAPRGAMAGVSPAPKADCRLYTWAAPMPALASAGHSRGCRQPLGLGVRDGMIKWSNTSSCVRKPQVDEPGRLQGVAGVDLIVGGVAALHRRGRVSDLLTLVTTLLDAAVTPLRHWPNFMERGGGWRKT